LKAAHTPRLLGLALVLCPATGLAQSLFDGDVLPAHVGGVIVSPGVGYGNGVLERFGRGWQFGRESILEDVDGLDLTEILGGNEQGINALRAVAGGQLGTTSFQASQNSFAMNFTAAYGITDRLTVALLVPFQWVRYDLDASLTYKTDYVREDGTPDDDRNAISDLRVNADPSAIRCPSGDFDFGPEDVARLGTRDMPGYRFNIGDLQRALTSDCLGYDPLFDRVEIGDDGLFHGRQSRTVSGFRDIAFGAKYQFFHGRHVRLAALGYLVAGTGRPADPDKLIDFKLGDGNWNAGLLIGATIPVGKLRIGLSVGYDVELPDSERLRLPNVNFSDDLEDRLARGDITERELLDNHIDDGNIQPLVTRFDVVEVKRKLGNNFNAYGIVSYQLLEWLSIGAGFTLLHHFRDRLTSIGDRPDGAAPYPTEQEVRDEVQGMVDRGEITSEEERIQALRDRLPTTVERKKAAYGWRTIRGQLAVNVGFNVNTLAMFARDEFPVPIIASVGITRFVAGQNIDTPDSINLNLTLPFAFGEVKDPATLGYDEDGEGPPWLW